MIKIPDQRQSAEELPSRDRQPESASQAGALNIYLKAIRKIRTLSREEERELFVRMRQGKKPNRETARTELIQAHLHLVVKIAHFYRHKGLPLADLISEGNIGLIKALERFDLSKEVRFCTYAMWWVKQEIRRGLDNQAGIVRIPVKVAERLRRMHSYRITLGREPTDEELGRLFNLGRKTITELRRADGIHSISLSSRLDETDNLHLGDILPDQRFCPFRETSEKDSREMLMRLLKGLDDRSQTILHLRFGLGSKEPESLEDIARKVGLSRERVRQIQTESLAKLKAAAAVA